MIDVQVIGFKENNYEKRTGDNERKEADETNRIFDVQRKYHAL